MEPSRKAFGRGASFSFASLFTGGSVRKEPFFASVPHRLSGCGGCSDRSHRHTNRRSIHELARSSFERPQLGLVKVVRQARFGVNVRLDPVARYTEPASTTVLQSIIRSPADDHSNDRAAVEAARGPGARRSWRSRWGHGVQAAPGVPRGVKPLGRRAALRKDRGAGGESLARSAARKAYAAIHNAP